MKENISKGGRGDPPTTEKPGDPPAQPPVIGVVSFGPGWNLSGYKIQHQLDDSVQENLVL